MINYKKAICLVFVLSLCINTYATSVGNNDGSAFITKAEFDALKSNFQSQIDTYNSGIDSKIDSAISSYLAGINLSSDPENIYDKVKGAVGGDFWVKNNIVDQGLPAVTSAVNVNLLRRFHYKYYDNLRVKQNYHALVSDTYPKGHLWTGMELLSEENNYGNGGFTLSIYDIEYDGSVDTTDITVTEYMGDEWLWGRNSQYPAGNAYDAHGIRAFGYTPMNTEYNVLTNASEIVKNSVSTAVDGTGRGWIFHAEPDGSITLREYAMEIFPVQLVELDCHTFKDFASKFVKASTAAQKTALETEIKDYYCTDNGKKDTTSLDITIPAMTKYEVKDCGETKRADDSTSTTAQKWWQVTLSQMKTTDLVDYSIYQWGDNTNKVLNCIQDNAQPVSNATKVIEASETASTFPSLVYRPKNVYSYDNELSGAKLTYTQTKLDVYSMKLHDFSNSYLSGLVGEDVRIGGGFPIAKPKSGDDKIKITLKFKSRDIDGNPVATDTVYYQLSNEQFVDGAKASTAKDLSGGVKGVVTGSEVVIEVNDVGANKYVWLNMYSATNNNDVSLAECKVEKANS